MGLGVLDDPHLEHVPGKLTHTLLSAGTRSDDVISGTSYVYDDASRPTDRGGIDSRLKHDGDVILVPQPSDDPNDPLVCICSQTWLPFFALLTQCRTGRYGDVM